MRNTGQPLTISQTACLSIAVLAAVVLWLYRDVASVEVALRILMPVLWLTVWTSACLGAGVWTGRLILGRHADPTLVVVLTSGAAALALLTTLMAAAGAFSNWPLRLVLAVAALEGARLVTLGKVLPQLPSITLASAPGVLLVAAGVVTLAGLTAPPVMFDALNYHLAFPSHWLDAGGFSEFPRHLYSYYPAAQGTVYGFALATVGPWGASAIHWWMGLMAVLATATLGERLGGRKTATWAAAVFALTPVVLEVAGYAIADLALAAWGGAALVVLLPSGGQSNPWRSGLLAGLLAGTAAAAKYLALATVLLPVVLAAILIGTRRPDRRWIAGVAALLVAATVSLSPWLIRNASWTGNPIYPYLQGVLGGPPCERDVARELEANASEVAAGPNSVFGAITAPVVRTFRPLRSGGLMGPHWLILIPAALGIPRLRSREAAPLWLAAAAGLMAWGALVHYARFLLPVFVPAAALSGVAAAALTSGSGSRLIGRLFSTLLVGLFGWNLTVLATGFQLDRLGVITGVASEESFVDRWVSYGPAIRAVDEALPSDATLLLVAEPRSMYLDRAVLVEDPYRIPLLAELATDVGSPDVLAQRVRDLGATHLLLNASEMDFYAGMRSHSDYWQDASPAERQIIERFLAENVRPILRTETLLLGEIVESSPIRGLSTPSRPLKLDHFRLQTANCCLPRSLWDISAADLGRRQSAIRNSQFAIRKRAGTQNSEPRTRLSPPLPAGESSIFNQSSIGGHPDAADYGTSADHIEQSPDSKPSTNR